MEKFWMCYVEGEKAPCHKHETYSDAHKEAERLVRLPNSQNKKVFILETIMSCQVPIAPIEWENLSG